MKVRGAWDWRPLRLGSMITDRDEGVGGREGKEARRVERNGGMEENKEGWVEVEERTDDGGREGGRDKEGRRNGLRQRGRFNGE